MKDVSVKICTGTTCYLMGATHLQGLENRLAPADRDRVEVVASHCLEVCNDPDSGQSPFVMVNDHLVANATPDRVIRLIQAALKGES